MNQYSAEALFAIAMRMTHDDPRQARNLIRDWLCRSHDAHARAMDLALEAIPKQ